MAGRKRKKLKSLPVAKAKAKASSYEENEHDNFESQLELPLELLEMIISRLTLKENIYASVVCKNWLVAAKSVRVVNKPPWLMSYPKSGDTVELYDPLQRKFYWIELPELQGSRLCHAKDGWLLIYKPTNHIVMFINPYTQETIELPSFDLNYQIVAFSAAPTSPDCFVFTIRHVSPTLLEVSTCCPGATQWTSANYLNRFPFVSTMWNKIVYSNDHFYCLSLTGWLGDYDKKKRTFSVHVLPPPKYPEKFFMKNWWKSKFMAELNGEIFVIYTSVNLNPIIYKLDRTRKGWVEIKTLGGLTFFASFLSSHVMTDLLGEMRNCVYFSRVRFYGRRCFSYSLDDCRYYPRKQSYDWGEDDPFRRIWIEPPVDLSTLM